MSSDPFDEMPSTWIAPRAAVQIMVGKLNIDRAEAARALVDANMHGKIPHRLEGERMIPPWGCDYSRHPLLSDTGSW